MSARPELIFFLKESLEFRSELQLRQQLARRGVSDADFNAALNEALYPPEYPEPSAPPAAAPRTPWSLIVIAAILSAAAGFGAGRLAGAPPPPLPAAAPGLPAAARTAPPPEDISRVEPAAAEPTPQRESNWVFKGGLYDLTNFEPIPDVKITLADAEGGGKIMRISDNKGRYRIVAPALSGRGYDVSFSHPGYSPTAMEDDEGPARSKSEQARLGLAGQLAHTTRPGRTLQGQDERTLVTDFYLAPR